MWVYQECLHLSLANSLKYLNIISDFVFERNACVHFFLLLQLLGGNKMNNNACIFTENANIRNTTFVTQTTSFQINTMSSARSLWYVLHLYHTVQNKKFNMFEWTSKKAGNIISNKCLYFIGQAQALCDLHVCSNQTTPSVTKTVQKKKKSGCS